MKNLTIQDLENLPSKILGPAKKVLSKKAERQKVASIVNPIKKAVLQEHQFEVTLWNDEPKTIADPEESYLLEEEQFETYAQDCHKEYLAAGFDVDFGYCPLLIAESSEVDAENELIKAAKQYTGIGRDQLFNLQNRRKYIKLLLELVERYNSMDAQSRKIDAITQAMGRTKPGDAIGI